MLYEKLFDLVLTYAGRTTAGVMYVVIFLLLWLLWPAFLYWRVARFSRDDFQGTDRDGVVLGLAIATWASACWLLLPGAGIYPNLPSCLLLAMAFGYSFETWWKELLVIALNFVIWPVAGCLFFRVARKSEHPRRNGSAMLEHPLRDRLLNA